MEQRPVAATALAVTPLCFGTSALGDMPLTYGYAVDEARARATFNAIFDGPVNFLDTSRNYGFGVSEMRIGQALAERGGLPQGFVLATKLDRNMETNRFDAARARQSLEESLEALGVERIQMLHLHDPEYAHDLSEVTRDGGAMDELFKIREEGLADAVGLAMGRLGLMEPLLAAYPFDALISHNRFTLLNRSADAMFDAAHARGIAIFNAAPFAGGILAKGSMQTQRITYQEADARGLDRVRRVEGLCATHNIPPGAAALQFSMQDARITTTIVGVSKPERVQQTLDWAATSIPAAARDALNALPFATDNPEAGREYRPG